MTLSNEIIYTLTHKNRDQTHTQSHLEDVYKFKDTKKSEGRTVHTAQRGEDEWKVGDQKRKGEGL
jgi:hypothetical protein